MRSGAPERADEERRSPRRRTRATARVLSTPAPPGRGLNPELTAIDLSADGAFLRAEGARDHVRVGDRLRLSLELPTHPRPIETTARIVRADDFGIGVRFEELAARDRSRLRSHTGFYETDQAIVDVQRSLGDLIPGNLLPLGERSELEAILAGAVERRLPVLALRPGRGFSPWECVLEAYEPGLPAGDPEAVEGRLRLSRLTPELPEETRVIYLTFCDPPLHYALEGLVLAAGERPVLMAPERLYLTERRAGGRSVPAAARCELAAPWLPGGKLRLPVLDLGERGASLRVPPRALLVPGTHLPSFTLDLGEGDGNPGTRRRIQGATVRYLAPLDGGDLRAGLVFDDGELDREIFKEVKPHAANRSLATRLSRAASLLGGKVASYFRGPDRRTREEGVEVVRYKNRRGDTVAAIVDANFNTWDPSVRPDVAVVIAPAILKRKEVFGLLARTLVDDHDRDGRKIVVLRFDATHVVGESTIDPRLEAAGRPYYNWTFSHLADDMAASLDYLERRFHPAKRALVSVSLSAIPARKVVLDPAVPPVDLWVAPYGCPDAQDVLRNYLAGLDLFEVYRDGEGPETVLIHGRPIDGRKLYGEAMASGMAFLDQAREDMSRFSKPVTWIVGSYDCWVNRSRVQALLDAPGGGAREVFECATGHVLKSGEEAIEVFKLVSESIGKHAFGIDRPAREPSLVRFAHQSELEWARVKRLELADTREFWKEHLLGGDDDEIGYDILLDHPEYPRFLARQVELLDPGPGEDLADFGCGTGNLLLAMLDAYPEDSAPASVTYVDLVADAVERTGEKLAARYRGATGPVPRWRGLVEDLEISRLAAIDEFLDGRLYGIEGLVNRVEGLPRATARKIARRYGKELHAILRGAPATDRRIAELAPDLEEREIEIVLELSRAARFLTGRTLPEDLAIGAAEARTAEDLDFHHLRFGSATSNPRLDLPEGSFHRIGCSLVVPYLYDPLAFLREMHRLLKPGGTLVVSSLRPNFDPSKLYSEGVEILVQEQESEERARKLAALRHFGNMVSRLVELEEDGRFRFLEEKALRTLVLEAGFADAHVFRAFGSPPVAVIVRAEK